MLMMLLSWGHTVKIPWWQALLSWLPWIILIFIDHHQSVNLSVYLYTCVVVSFAVFGNKSVKLLNSEHLNLQGRRPWNTPGPLSFIRSFQITLTSSVEPSCLKPQNLIKSLLFWCSHPPQAKKNKNTYVFVFPKSSPRLRYYVCFVCVFFFYLTIILLYTVLDYLTSPINI